MGRRPRCHARHIRPHCYPRRTPRPDSCPILAQRRPTSAVRRRSPTHRRDQRRRADRGGCHLRPRGLRRPPSRSSMPDTSPAKRPPTRARGRSLCEPYAAINRQELLATTPEWVNIDHRRGATFAPGDANAYVRASLDDGDGQHLRRDRASAGRPRSGCDHGRQLGPRDEGFDAEWRGIHVLTVDGDLLSRFEVFDEADLDAAIARFDQLSRPAPRLENAASQVDRALLGALCGPRLGRARARYWPTTSLSTIAGGS